MGGNGNWNHELNGQGDIPTVGLDGRNHAQLDQAAANLWFLDGADRLKNLVAGELPLIGGAVGGDRHGNSFDGSWGGRGAPVNPASSRCLKCTNPRRTDAGSRPLSRAQR